MEKLVQMVLPYGNLIIKWPSVEDMLKGLGEELAAVGLSTTDMISGTLDLKMALQHRAGLLLKEGLIKPGESLSIQLVDDATEIFNATRTNGTIVVLKWLTLSVEEADALEDRKLGPLPRKTSGVAEEEEEEEEEEE
eukprot:jgi/Tetstr1/447010/TSEL_034468.t1